MEGWQVLFGIGFTGALFLAWWAVLDWRGLRRAVSNLISGNRER